MLCLEASALWRNFYTRNMDQLGAGQYILRNSP